MEDPLRPIVRPPETPSLRDVPPNDLGALLRSRVPMIVIESRDEPQVLKALVRACPSQALGGSDLPLFQWTVTDGLKRIDREVGVPQRTIAEPAEVLRHIRATNLPGVFALLDFHPYLRDPTHVRLLKDIALDYERCARTVVLISYELPTPPEVEHLNSLAALRAELQATPEGDPRHAQLRVQIAQLQTSVAVRLEAMRNSGGA